MATIEVPKILQPEDSVNKVISDHRISEYISKNEAVASRAREAAAWLIKNYPNEPPISIAATVVHLLPALLQGKVSVFFSYKGKDSAIATQLAQKLQIWSAGKLEIHHMGELGTVEVGRDWYEKIMKTIPECHWFLLLLPTPGDQRDWVLFEAGYYFRGQGLGGRLVCLHHPDNRVAEALGEHQSVPANIDSVKAFLTALFLTPNWIPGMPPLNEYLDQLDAKAKEIVDLIHAPVSPGVKLCCGPHMQVCFEDAAAVRSWAQLSVGHVSESNDDCRRLFGLLVPKLTFGEWVKEVPGAGQDTGWVIEMARAVRAAGEGRQVPPIDATLALGENRNVRAMICAVKRRCGDQKVEAVDIAFTEADRLNTTAWPKPRKEPKYCAAPPAKLQETAGGYSVAEHYNDEFDPLVSYINASQNPGQTSVWHRLKAQPGKQPFELRYYVLKGCVQFETRKDSRGSGVSTYRLDPGDSLLIPDSTWCCFQATGKETLEMLVICMPRWRRECYETDDSGSRGALEPSH